MLEYLNAFSDGLIKVLPLTTQGTETFLYMMLGMAIGFAVGILPGTSVYLFVSGSSESAAENFPTNPTRSLLQSM